MKKIFLTIGSGILVLFFIVPQIMIACGMVMMWTPQNFFPASQSTHISFLSHHDGQQHIISGFSLDELEPERGLAWVLPVPATGEDISVVPLREDEIPNHFLYESMYKELREIGEDGLLISTATQLYTIPFILGYWSLTSVLGAGRGGALNGSSMFGLNDAGSFGVEVHSSVELDGLISEVLSAQTIDGLQDYLRFRGAPLEPNSLDVFDTYLGGEFSFIASWVPTSDVAVNKIQHAIVASFPSEDLYYPVIPMSAQGDQDVTVTLNIVGHVTPRIPRVLKEYTDVEYGVNGRMSVIDDSSFFSQESTSVFDIQNISEGKVTRVRIAAPSHAFTEDIVLETRSPAGVSIANTILRFPFVYGILVFLIVSMVASRIAARIMLKEFGISPLKQYLLGLTNVFSIIGVIIAAIFLKPKNDVLDKKHRRKARRRFVIVFSFLFLVLSMFVFIGLPQIFV